MDQTPYGVGEDEWNGYWNPERNILYALLFSLEHLSSCGIQTTLGRNFLFFLYTRYIHTWILREAGNGSRATTGVTGIPYINSCLSLDPLENVKRGIKGRERCGKGQGVKWKLVYDLNTYCIG